MRLIFVSIANIGLFKDATNYSVQINQCVQVAFSERYKRVM